MGALAFFPETFSIEEPEISVDPSLGPAAQKLLLEAQQQIDAQAASSQ